MSSSVPDETKTQPRTKHYLEGCRVVTIVYTISPSMIDGLMGARYGAAIYRDETKAGIDPAKIRHIKRDLRKTALQRFDRFPVKVGFKPKYKTITKDEEKVKVVDTRDLWETLRLALHHHGVRNR